THAAVLFRNMRAEHPRIACLVPQRAVDMTVLFPLRMVRHCMLFEKLAHAVAKQFVIGAEQGSWNHCYSPEGVAQTVTVSQDRSATHWTVAPKNKTIRPPAG